jgi:ADP-ribose pyrophosphatase
MEQGRGAWVLEPVGGVVERGSDPAAAVKREAMEEAGCDILALELVGTFYVSPGISDDQVTLYCGRVNAPSAGRIHGVWEEGEETKVVILDAEQAFRETFTGRINTMTAIIGIQWLAVNRRRLRLAWN